MDKKFFCQWFKGFENGLDEMDSDSRSCLLKHCAKYCADTGVLQFPECACDIYTVGGINTPNLCKCSRQSIIYVGESIWNESKFHVEQVETILSGDAECKFRIRFD